MGGVIGRPPSAVRRQQIGVRTSPSLKAQLEEAARTNGRSVAQEAELRLIASFDYEDAADYLRKALGLPND